MCTLYRTNDGRKPGIRTFRRRLSSFRLSLAGKGNAGSAYRVSWISQHRLFERRISFSPLPPFPISMRREAAKDLRPRAGIVPLLSA